MGFFLHPVTRGALRVWVCACVCVQYGTILRCWVVRDPLTARSLGYGYVEFSSEKEVRAPHHLSPARCASPVSDLTRSRESN